MYRTLLLIGSFSLHSIVSICQTGNGTFVTPISNEISFDFGDGLITDIQEDWNGFIWVATSKGLYRFDGTEVRKYDESDDILPHSLVYSIYVDHQEERIWLATRGGLAKFDPAEEKAQVYRHNPNEPSSLADDLARRVIKDRNGRIWVSCANRGLDLLLPDGLGFKHFFFDHPQIEELRRQDYQLNLSALNSFTAVVQDAIHDEVLWLGGPFGFLRLDVDKEEFEWIDSPLKDLDQETPETSLVELYSLDKRLLVGHTAGAYVYDTEKKAVEHIDTRTAHGDLLRVIKFTEYDDMVAISFRNGLAQLDKATLEVKEKWFDQPDLNRIYGIQLVDRAGRSWISSSGEFHLHHGFANTVTAYLLPESHRKSPQVVKILNDDQLLCLTAQSEHFYVFDLKQMEWQVRSFRGTRPQSTQWRDFIKMDNDHLILLARDNLFKLNFRTGFISPLAHDFNLVRPRFSKLLLDQQNDLWIGSLDHGLFRLNLTTGLSENFSEEFNTVRNSSVYSWITTMLEDQSGKIWIRLGRGYAIYDPDTKVFTTFPLHKYPRSFRYIRNFSEGPDGNIWISSEDRGIGRTESEDLSRGMVDFINADSGLSSNNIMQIDFDAEGRLWILSDVGFDTFEPANRGIRKSTWSVGIPKSNQFFFLPDGAVCLVLSTGGVGIFNPKLLNEERPIPQPYLSKIRVRDRLIFQGNRPKLENVQIFTHRDFLAFEYSALGFLNPKEFAYRLEGVDEDWIETTERQTASYSNLKPGTYSFDLKARNAGGKWSAVNSISVFLAPVWYETWWFKAGLALLLIAAIYLLYRWRLNSVRKNERIKADFQQKLNEVEMQALRSQMNPHFLFNSLNSIQHFIIKNQPKEAVDYLNRFSRLVRLILQHSRAKLVTLKEELDALKLYLDLENLRFKNRFSYQLEVDPALNQNDIEIPPMLIQPFVENAIWHGLLHKKESGHIRIKMNRKDEVLTCVIEDNGIGRKASAARKSNFNQHRKSMGMSITKDRLDIINHQQMGDASVVIHDLTSEAGESTGTKVEISLPI